jgi:anti-anti-sigma regulatory factor
MLDITVSFPNGLALVGLKGALVRGEGDYLTEVVGWLRDAGDRRIALHAAGVTAVDLDGLVALMECHTALNQAAGCLVIKMPSAALRAALRRSGLDAVLRIMDRPDPASRSASVPEA